MSNQTTVSFLLVCYNARHFLDACLNSVREMATVPYEVILLDNGSVDDTSEFVRERFPWVHLIRSEDNLGFTKGNNLAARSACGKYYLLLNSDTVLLSDIAPAIRVLESDPCIGVVGARMYDRRHKVRPSTGRFPRALRLWRFGSLWLNPNEHPYGPPTFHCFKVDWVEGSFFLTTAENWSKVGGLDEQAFLYGDDVDFCRSTANRGLLTVHCSDVEYLHFGGCDTSRTGYLFAAFRRYHRKFSTYPEQLLADLVLRVGLLARIVLYGLRYWLTRDALSGEKFRQFVKVQRNWANTGTIAPRFS